MPVLPERARLYRYLPEFTSTQIHNPNRGMMGTLYLRADLSQVGLSSGIISPMQDAFQRINPAFMGQSLRGVGKRAGENLIRDVTIGGERFVLKRARSDRADLADRIARIKRIQGISNEERQRQIYVEKRRQSYFFQVRAAFAAEEAYRQIVLQDPTLMQELGPDLEAEEIVGCFVGRNGEYWVIYKRYEEVVHPETGRAVRTLQNVRRRVALLTANGFDLFDPQPMNVRSQNGTIDAKLIDLEFLRDNRPEELME